MNEATNILVDVDLEPNSSAKINGNKIKFQTQTSCDSTSSADQGKMKKKFKYFIKNFHELRHRKSNKKELKLLGWLDEKLTMKIEK